MVSTNTKVLGNTSLAYARSVIEGHGYHANTTAFQRTQTTLEIG
jgi:hypothetical protein